MTGSDESVETAPQTVDYASAEAMVGGGVEVKVRDGNTTLSVEMPEDQAIKFAARILDETENGWGEI